MAEVLFIILALGAVATSLMVVVGPGGKNPLYGALALVLSFFFIAGLYVLLVAHLMAALQILVYAGAIMVLFVFVIMLLNLSEGELGKQTINGVQALGLVAIGFMTVRAVMVVEETSHGLTPAPLASDFGTVDAVGDMLFRQFLFPFELTGILLLVAVIGAVVLAKRSL